MDFRQLFVKDTAEKSPIANFRAPEDYSVGFSSPIHFLRNKHIFLKILNMIMIPEHHLILGAETLIRS
jgi:hypothetical protein